MDVNNDLQDRVEYLLMQAEDDVKEFQKEMLRQSRKCTILFAIGHYRTISEVVNTYNLSASSALGFRDPLEIYAPMTIQAIQKMISYLLDDPANFAEAVYDTKESKYYQYITSIIVPAVFANFCFAEMVELAGYFYLDLVNQVNLESFSKIITPFFGAACITQFSKITFIPVINYFAQRSPLPSVFIIKCLEKTNQNLHILPQAHLMILEFIHKVYGQEELSKLLIRVLIIPQVHTYITTTAHVQRSFVDAVINELRQCKSEHLRIVDASNAIQSSFELPHLPESYDRPLECPIILSPADVAILAQLKVSYPPTVSPLFMTNLELNVDSMFIISIQMPMLITQLPKEKLFEMSCDMKPEYMETLEKVLSSSLVLDPNETFSTLCNRYEDRMSLCMVRQEKQVFQRDQIMAHIINISKRAVIGTVTFWRAVKALDVVESVVLKPVLPTLLKLESAFSSLLIRMKTQFQADLCISHRVLREYFSEATAGICLVSMRLSFMDRFIALLDFFRGFAAVVTAAKEREKKEFSVDLLKFAFILYDPVWIARTAVYVNAVAFRCEPFCLLAPKDVYDSWMRFTPALLQILALDQTCLDTFTQLTSDESLHI